MINWLTKWTSKPSFFERPDRINLKSGMTCCALFIIIDRLAQAILSSFIKEGQAEKPIYVAVRIGASIGLTYGLFCVLSPRFQLPSLALEEASTIIVTALVVYSQAIFYLLVYDKRNSSS